MAASEGATRALPANTLLLTDVQRPKQSRFQPRRSYRRVSSRPADPKMRSVSNRRTIISNDGFSLQQSNTL